MKNLFSIFILLVLAASCVQDNDKPGKMISSVKTDGKRSNADIIRNPISADGMVDSINVAKIEFEEMKFNFDTVREGDFVNHDFHFKNTGKVPLIIIDARSTCGCTVPNWPKTPIEPGKSEKISVKFDTKKKPNKQSKAITIVANTYPKETELILHGFVTPKD